MLRHSPRINNLVYNRLKENKSKKINRITIAKRKEKKKKVRGHQWVPQPLLLYSSSNFCSNALAMRDGSSHGIEGLFTVERRCYGWYESKKTCEKIQELENAN